MRRIAGDELLSQRTIEDLGQQLGGLGHRFPASASGEAVALPGIKEPGTKSDQRQVTEEGRDMAIEDLGVGPQCLRR